MIVVTCESPKKSLRLRSETPISYRRLLRAFGKHAHLDIDDIYVENIPSLDDVVTESHVLVVKRPKEAPNGRIPVIVIVLDRDPMRVEHARKLEGRKVSAVDGRDEEALRSALKRHDIRLHPEFARSCTVGQLGCACSHIDVWKSIKKTTIVLEDDAVVCVDFAKRVRDVVDQATLAFAEWDWIYLFFHPECVPPTNQSDLKTDQLVQPGFETWGTVAYVLTKNGAEKLVEYSCGVAHDAPIDHLVMRLARQGILNTLCTTKLLATTAGQLNPLQPAASTKLGSNVWQSPKLLS